MILCVLSTESLVSKQTTLRGDQNMFSWINRGTNIALRGIQETCVG